MSQLITRRVRLSRRFFLKGLTLSQAPVIIGLPPLVSMFNSTGTAYAAEANPVKKTVPFDRRFVLWFNGNGIPERYWIPDRTGPDYDVTACLTPLARLHDHFHVLSGLDNSAVGNAAGDGHSTSMSALMTCTHYTGRSPGGPSVDQIIARKLAAETRFRSLQIGVSQESFGSAIHKNMSWAGPDRPLAPEEIPHRLFDRLFGAKDQGWVDRKRSILDAVYQDANLLRKGLPQEDAQRLDEHLSSIRDLERAITSLPPEYREVAKPDEDFDMKDWPRIAISKAICWPTRWPRGRRGWRATCLPSARAWRASRGWATTRRGTTTTRTPTVKRRARTGRWASASCATSAAGTCRSSRIWWPSSSPFPKETARCSITPAWCLCMSTRRRTSTRTAA